MYIYIINIYLPTWSTGVLYTTALPLLVAGRWRSKGSARQPTSHAHIIYIYTHQYIYIYKIYLHHRRVVDDGLAAAGGSGDRQVPPGHGGVDGAGLVEEEAGDACG